MGIPVIQQVQWRRSLAAGREKRHGRLHFSGKRTALDPQARGGPTYLVRTGICAKQARACRIIRGNAGKAFVFVLAD